MTEIQYEIKQSLGELSESKTGWKREVNMISWNNAEPKLDIRDWSPDHSKMGKGISLNKDEVNVLKTILSSIE